MSDLIRHLDAEWSNWINHNIRSGCTPESLLSEMIQSQFDPLFACAAIYTRLSVNEAAQAEEDSSQVYVYEQPRFYHSGPVIAIDDRLIRVVCRVDQPVIRVLDNVLSAEECDQLIQISTNKLQRSKVIDTVTGEETVIKERTSYGAFFTVREDEFIAKLDERIAKLMNSPVEHGEGLQVLNYKVGGEYRTHVDYFSRAAEGEKHHLRGGQRVSTLVIYLNDVEEGGETTFPEIQLSVTPNKGSAVYFEYTNSLGQSDPMTLHAGAPVIRGEKWIATKWVRERNFE